MTAPLLRVDGAVKHFELSRSIGDILRQKEALMVHAVDEVSFDVMPGETVGLIGESGSGKTTLGWVISRLLPLSSGRLYFDGQDVTHLSGAELRGWRRNVQIVFQDPVGSLDPRMRVWQIVSESLTAQRAMARRRAVQERARLRREYRVQLRQWAREERKRARRPTPPGSIAPAPLPKPSMPVLPEIPKSLGRTEIRERVRETLTTVGLPPDCLDQYPHEFSGGGRQRVSLARALIVGPKLVVLDEPTSALDVAVQAQILNRLVALQRERGIAYLLITHNVAAVRYVADRVAVMYLGKFAEVGPVREVLEHPLHPYTKALLAALPVPDARRRRTHFKLGGDVPTLINPPPGCRFASRCPFVIDRCRTEEPRLRTIAERPNHTVACHRAEELQDVAPEALIGPASTTIPEGPAALTSPY